MNTGVKNNIIVNQVNNKSWAGGLLPFLYDFSMEKNVIPKKMGASTALHNMIIRKELSNVSGRILELAAGSGNLSGLIGKGVDYSGVDISMGLLKIASKKFSREGFSKFQLYNCSAEKLPFADNEFDCCVSILSLNFFSDIEKVLKEASRVLKPGARFFGCVPVPERNTREKLIRGKLFSENELKRFFAAAGLSFKPLEADNGAVLYFNAVSGE